jgi:hypothetical protein
MSKHCHGGIQRADFADAAESTEGLDDGPATAMSGAIIQLSSDKSLTIS